jgi:hypothetical protein
LKGGREAGGTILFNPQEWSDAVKIGMYHLEAGARAFNDWAAKMIGDYGENIKPHLENIWATISPSVSKEPVAPPQIRKQGFLSASFEKLLPESVKEGAERIYQNYINRFASIENAVEKAQRLGMQIQPGENSKLLARAYLGLGRKVESILQDQTFRITPEGGLEITGEGLKPILDGYDKAMKPLQGDRKQRHNDLKTYLFAQRTILDLRRVPYEGAKKEIVSPEQVREAQDDLAQLKARYGDKGMAVLAGSAERLYEFQKRILHLLVDAGNLSQAQYDTIVDLNKHYIPFDRIVDEHLGGVPVTKKRFTEARAPVKRIKGSELAKHDPIESIIKNTFRVVDSADRNTVARSVAALREILPDDIAEKDINIVPVARVKHHAVIDPGFFQEITEFAKRMGATFKTGKEVTPGRPTGTYTPALKQAMRRQAAPATTLAHETGHFFDDKFGLKRRFYKRGATKAVAQELIDFMEQMGESKNRRGKPEERFADGFAWWLYHRDLAEQDIPKFSQAMADIIRDIPEIKPLLAMRPRARHGLESQEQIIFGPSPFKPKGNVIEYFENGKRKYIEVTPNLYAAMNGLNENAAGLIVKIFSKPANWLRVGATITPEFMLRNPFRDQWTAFMQTSFGFTPFVDSAAAIADIIGKSEAYHDWLRSGGAYSGFVELNRPALKKAAQLLTGKRSLLRRLNIIADAQDISQLMEQATRLGVYKAARAAGKSAIEAGFESREATIDYARKGAKMADVNRVMTFFSAGVQGADKTVRTAIEHPYATAIKGIAAITIPSLLLFLRNRRDPEYANKPRWEKDLFWMVKLGGIWWRFPKPFLYGQIFGSIPERFFEYAQDKDPAAFNDLAKSIYDAISPVSGDAEGALLMTAVKPIVENATNYNFFLERKIVPEARERLAPSEQYTRYTTEAAKYLGKHLNYSPAKIENLIRGWFGGTGRYALEGADYLSNSIRRAAGESIPSGRPKELSDYPLVKGFVSRPGTESVNRFYDESNRIIQNYRTAYSMAKEGRRGDVLALATAEPNLRLGPAMIKIQNAMSELQHRIDALNRSEISVAQKRAALKQLDAKRLLLAQRANLLIKRSNK